MKSFLAFLILAAVSASAAVTSTKLTPKWPTGVTPTNYQMGFSKNASAINPTWTIVGAPDATVVGLPGAGAVQVFKTATGAFSRRLEPPTPNSGMKFGAAVALSGDLAYVGAANVGNPVKGAVYVFNLTTGAMLKKLQPSNGSNGDGFGAAIAIGNGLIAVSSTVGFGNVWLYEQRSYAYRGEHGQVSLLNGTNFGASLSIEGKLILVGAPDKDGKGTAFLFHLDGSGLTLIEEYDVGNMGERVGHQVILHRGLAILGTDGINKVYVRDIRSGTTRILQSNTGKLIGSSIAADNGIVAATEPGNTIIHFFNLSSPISSPYSTFTTPFPFSLGTGYHMSMNGNSLVVTDPFADDVNTNTGMAYVYQQISRPNPLLPVAATGDIAPGTASAKFSGLSEAIINNDGETAIIARLNGPDSGNSTDRGVWNELMVNLDLSVRSRDPVGTSKVSTTVDNLVANDNANCFFQTTLTGTGATTGTNRALFWDNGSTVTPMVRLGQPMFLTNLVPSSFGQLSQARIDDRIAFLTKLKTAPGSVSSSSDSALMWRDFTAEQHYLFREGDPANGVTLGEFANHFAYFDNHIFFQASLQGAPTTTNQAIFKRNHIVDKPAPNPETAETELIKRKGDPVINAIGNIFPDDIYSSFLGLSIDDSEMGVFKATYKYVPTGSIKTGLWRVTGNTVDRWMLGQGEFIIGQLGNVDRIEEFWAAYQQCIALVSFKGTKVTPDNDRAVILLQTLGDLDHQRLVLLREGDPAPGCQPAKIGVIQKVEVDPFYGQYLILVTLTGAPKGTDLVLYRGHSKRGSTNAFQYLRLPYPILRKGMLFDGETVPLSSFSLTGKTTLGGAGSAGLGKAMQEPTDINIPSKLATIQSFGTAKKVGEGTP